jgi:hypothetical protein
MTFTRSSNTKFGLHHPKESAWNKFLNSDNDQAMITLTGLYISAFKWLNNLLQPVYDEYSWVLPSGHIQKLTKNMCRKRLMSSLDCLALCLAWTRTKGN